MYRNIFKRFADLLLAALLLVLLTPLFLILIITGTAAMKGNPFFFQKRPGKSEKIFTVIKFRTMTNRINGKGELCSDRERITRYGAFLRNYSLDELPELLNILKGDMSFVGPRPLLIKYLPLYSQEQRKRHSVLPGLTGYAQIHGRNDIPWNKKFQFDLFYVENLSFFLDLQILFKTIIYVLKPQGIHKKNCITAIEFKGATE